jgi:hypothetical protein
MKKLLLLCGRRGKALFGRGQGTFPQLAVSRSDFELR